MSRTLARLSQLPRIARPRTFTPTFTPNTRAFHATAANMTVTEFTSKADFDAAVAAHKFVVIDATATWCGPCKMISPIFEKLSEEERFKDIFFAKFDVDKVPALTGALDVRAMPSFFAYQDGAVLDSVVGANPPALTKLVEKGL